MGKPAARMFDMHVCPMVTPGVPPVPHIGGPIISPCAPTVLIGSIPAARATDMCICVGPPDSIVMGSPTVLIVSLMAARIGDPCSHGGMVAVGLPTVLIGETGPGGGGGGGGGAGGAAAAAPAAKKPPAKAGPAPNSTGLGKDVDAIVNKSPTLAAKVAALQAKGWTISYGVAGKGTFCDKDNKKIVIDPNQKGNPAGIAQSVAHEAGHAAYTKDPYVPDTGLSKADYVKANVNRDLKDEGEATMSNIEARKEILANGGPDIGIAGTQTAKYEAAAKKFPNAADRDAARQEIGNVFANGEHPSTDPSKTYKQYYSKAYEDFYDKRHPPGP